MNFFHSGKSYQLLFSGGWDGDIHVWDARRPHSVKRFYGPFIAGEGIDIDKKGKELAVSCWRSQHQLQILDYGSGEIISDIEPERQTSYLSCVQYLGRLGSVFGKLQPNFAGNNQSQAKKIPNHTSYFAEII